MRREFVKISKSKLTIAAASVVSALGLGIQTQNVEAANWLMLQGTEPNGTAGRAKVWGFVQPEYQHIKGSTVPAGKWKGNPMQPNTLGPDRNSSSGFNIRRARIGVRGQGFPLDGNTNYFILGEFGHNGVTSAGKDNKGGGAKLTDASITLNHIPFARLRVGQFKYPGSEEGLQAIHVFDYINFTNGADQLLLERFANGDGSSTYDKSATDFQNGPVNSPNGGVGAFRDIGIQLFDTIKTKGWEHSYAFMIGNGNGINRQDNNSKKDFYGYLSTEMIFGGKGGRRQGVKLFGWGHMGKRSLEQAGEIKEDVDRNRYGVGFTFRKAKYRAAAEYIMASGLIRNGTDGAAKIGSTASANGVTPSLNYLTDDEASAYYVHLGYQVLKKLELDLRYDVLNRATKVAKNERKWQTITLGAQYFINKKTRITVNYEIRSLEAPGHADTAGPNIIGDELDNRASVQMLAIF